MAEDVLCLTLYDLEEQQAKIPAPSEIQKIKTNADEFVNLISCDTIEYRKYYDNKAVKKTLTIPAWLNTMSEREGINFSSVLQTALKNELHITDRYPPQTKNPPGRDCPARRGCFVYSLCQIVFIHPVTAAV